MLQRLPRLLASISSHFPCSKLASAPQIATAAEPSAAACSSVEKKKTTEKGLFIPYRIAFLVSIGPARRSANEKSIFSLTDLPLMVKLGPDTLNGGSANLLKPLQKLNGPFLKPSKATKEIRRKLGPCPLFKNPEMSGSPLRPKPRTRSWFAAMLCYINYYSRYDGEDDIPERQRRRCFRICRSIQVILRLR